MTEQPVYNIVCDALLTVALEQDWRPTEAHLALDRFAKVHSEWSLLFADVPDEALVDTYRRITLIDPSSGTSVDVLPDHTVALDDVLCCGATGQTHLVAGAFAGISTINPYLSAHRVLSPQRTRLGRVAHWMWRIVGVQHP